MHNNFWFVIALTGLLLNGAGNGAEQQSPSETKSGPTGTTSVVLYLDTSGSMQGSRGAAMKEGAKLAVATLDSNQEVVIVNFCDKAHAERFTLRKPAEPKRPCSTSTVSLSKAGPTTCRRLAGEQAAGRNAGYLLVRW